MSSIKSSFSSSNTTSVSDIIEKWKTNIIASFCLGISKINFASKLSYEISHSAILLFQKEIYFDCDEEELGILIEYGDYSPNMSKEESESVKDGKVIYHYGDKGGLRYYVKTYCEFIEEFTDLGYVDLNIDPENQQTFEHFTSIVANKEDNKWIKEKYSIAYGFNCQTFSTEAIKVLKPHFNAGNIFPSDNDLKTKKYIKKLDFTPSNIRTELVNFYRK